MISALQNAARGLRDAETRFVAAGAALGRLGTDPPEPASSRADSGDLSRTAVEVVAARASFAANTAVLRTADQMSRRLIDMRV